MEMTPYAPLLNLCQFDRMSSVNKDLNLLPLYSIYEYAMCLPVLVLALELVVDGGDVEAALLPLLLQLLHGSLEKIVTIA